ncbi:unnamed protein product [Penicillium egyptiacum]|uniref:Carrier domain-containing protein n=1 Tax=Penicillium egyptiacum TaxID=1303716 RepID=A0A9W4KED0_9EURO|nr:unnamed protein product [Penicillium egyptiacum]
MAAPSMNISLLHNESDSADAIMQMAAMQCQVLSSRIGDVYPCTAAQEGLFALSIKRPSSYTARYVYNLPSDTDLPRFKRAIEATVDAHTILRTRLIQHDTHGTLQAVLHREKGMIASADNLEAYLIADVQKAMPPGAPLIRIALVHGPHCTPTLVITIHHALYDDWSLNVVLHDIERAYDGSTLALRAFSDFTALSLRAQSQEAAAYWRKYLKSVSASQFPRLPSSSSATAATSSLVRHVAFPESLRSETHQSAAIELAWGMLLSLYTGSSDVVFGVTLTGRRAQLLGIEDMSGPTIATVPFRVQVSPEMKVADVLQDLLNTGDEMLPFEQRGLYHIGRLGDEAAAACQFQNLVVIQSPQQHHYAYLQEVTQDLHLENHATFGTYPLTLVCDLSENSMRVQAVYDEKVICETQMQRILNQLGTLLGSLVEQPQLALGEINIMSANDIDQLKKWNGQFPTKVDECMNDLILNQCRVRPEAPAVTSWDGEFSYRELEELSGRLSASLIDYGIGQDVVIPVYFEKSKWTTVALLAVMRAGFAFVLLDPSTPLRRNQTICQQVNATCILTSVTLHKSGQKLLDHVIPVGYNTSALQPRQYSVQQKASPSSLLYCVFTSGSTGNPKGVQIEHGSFTTSTKAYIATSQMMPETRALQFASYAFDVSISDTLVTLAAGGCICVPSEEQRQSGLPEVVALYNVNWADFTPSVLRQFQPEQFPSLRNIILGGEPMLQADIDTWKPHVHLLNIYGPAECCVLSTVQNNITGTTDARDIGYGTGCTCWVVDPTNHNKLMPIGVIGELLIEGPIVGRGYLADAEKTAASFIDDTPPWLPVIRPGASPSRMYRTGDLVQYTPQGSLRYVGRKDMQVKLNGQRVEVEEVQYHLYCSFPGVEEVVVDLVLPPALEGRPQLVAFITGKWGLCKDATDIFVPPTGAFFEAMATAKAALQKVLPAFMIPSYFLPITRVPRTVSDKTNLQSLRKATNALTGEQMAAYRQQPTTGPKKPPVSQAAVHMQKIWAQVLKISLGQIGLEDGFFQLGGDSITAMKVANIAKSQGLSISVPDLFKNSSLDSLVQTAESQADIPSCPSRWDWEMETALRPDITDTGANRKGKVALTGSTGFLGQKILRLLIENYAVKEVHCLAVRSQGSGVGRRNSALESDKVIVHSGDLSLPNLGLCAEAFTRVIQSCEAIIHCGADISFVKSYDLLKATNVGATQEIARMAIKHGVPIHYISSAALSHLTRLDSFGEVSVRHFRPATDGQHGYLTSKWVSEVYLERCNETHGVPVTIHRISSIVGCDAPAMDITNNVLNMSRKLRAVPDLSSCKGYVDLISVQNAASNIITDALGQHSSTAVTYANESGEVRVAASRLHEYLEKEAEEPFNVVQLPEWIQSARKCGMPELVASFLDAMPPSEIDIAMPFLRTRRIGGRAVSRNPSLPAHPTRSLGRGGPQIPRLGFGAMPLSVFYLPRPTDEERLQLLDQVYSMGLTHWDSADCYADNEEILGKWFARTGRRHDIFLASKFAVTSEDGGQTWIVRNDPSYVQKACNLSLQKLGVDSIDLYYCHRMSGETPIEETVEAMVRLKNEGKIRYLGLSECSADTLRRACKIHHIKAVQVEYSPFSLDIEDPTIDLLKTCRDLGVAVVAYSPLGRGFLAGKIKSIDDIPEGDVRRSLPRFQPENFANNLRLVDIFNDMAGSKGVPVASLVLSWLMLQGDDIFPVPGSTNARNIEQNLLAFGITFTDKEVRVIRTALKDINVAGDRYGEG